MLSLAATFIRVAIRGVIRCPVLSEIQSSTKTRRDCVSILVLVIIVVCQPSILLPRVERKTSGKKEDKLLL